MTIVGVAFVPSAPLLVREVAGGSAAADEDLRESSIQAIRQVTGGNVDRVVVAAPTDQPGTWDGSATWDFAGFGLAPRVVDGQPLPWQLGIGAWLLDEFGWTGDRTYVGISADGASYEIDGGRCAVLAVGDGSACRAEKAPGHLDDRAAGFDAAVAGALADGDVGALRDLDRSLAAELMCAGVEVWRWVAGLVAGPVRAELLTDDARYGVGYFVAAWTFG